jgi:hypothetical protein
MYSVPICIFLVLAYTILELGLTYMRACSCRQPMHVLRGRAHKKRASRAKRAVEGGRIATRNKASLKQFLGGWNIE